MFYYCCYQSKTEVDTLKKKVEEMKKQINNIYELLEVLTNESKSKNILEQLKIIQNKQQPIILTKPQSSYKKLEKAMNEPPKEYEQIKKLVDNNDAESIHKKSENDIHKIIPHKKK